MIQDRFTELSITHNERSIFNQIFAKKDNGLQL